MKYLFLSLILAQLPRFGAERKHYVDYPLVKVESSADAFPWQDSGPSQFLDLIKNSDHGITVQGVHYSWIHEEDLPDLIARFDSKEQCSTIASVMSSSLSTGRSTVGHEAMLLVEGFRRGRYPFFLNSDRSPLSESEVYELRQWCRRFLDSAKQ